MPEFFVYKCSRNADMETLVPTDRTEEYENRDCETLDRIVYWPE